MVTLVLVDTRGELLGALPPFAVPTPWRQEIREVVDGAQAAFDLPVTILRILPDSVTEADAADPSAVSYLASTTGVPGVPLGAASVDGQPQPYRARYAQPGGPQASLAWARGVLGLPGDSPATQVRSWNLASIWTLATPAGRVWLKEVPDFFRHEGALLEWLAGKQPGLAPRPLAVDGGRVLLADVPGEDRYDSPMAHRLGVLRRVHQAQVACVAAVPELLALGVPDGRAQPLAARIRDTVHRYGDPALLTGLDEHLTELAACGIPDTLVHGDLHPGNIRGLGSAQTATGDTVLDWGDSVIAHPGYDLLRMIGGLSPAEAAVVTAEWCSWWRAQRPGCRPERAVELLQSLSALRSAAVNAYFLDHIEPAERQYHRADVPHWLAVAAASLTPVD